MADAPYQELRFGFESARFRLGSSSLSPLLSPSTRRLSIGGVEPSSRRRSPAPSAARQLSWMSLQGWLVDAEEASSARAIKGGLKPEQAVAWELFSPIQRVLFIAIISVAAAESKKNRLISQLKKSVEFRVRKIFELFFFYNFYNWVSLNVHLNFGFASILKF